MKRALLLGLLTTAPVSSWYEATAPQIRVLAPSAEQAQVGAARLDESLRLFRSLGLELIAPSRPVTALLLPDLVSLEPFLTRRQVAGGRVRAVSFRGPDRNWIVVAIDAPGEPEVALAHELAHLTDREQRQPHWRREGRAEFLARLRRSPPGLLAPRIEEGLLEQLHAEGAPAASQLAAATADDTVVLHPFFYPLAWLVYDWLYSRGSGGLEVPPKALDEALIELGDAGVAAALDNHALALATVPPSPVALPVETPVAAAGSSDDAVLWRAEALRELGKRTLAHELLLSLKAKGYESPRFQAALGALEMDLGQIAEAERRLAIAAADPAAEAHVRHRFAIVLLHPGPDSAARARQAAAQARLALAERPDEPLIRLTLAQAEMVAGEWDAAAAQLRALARDPAWRPRADEEFEELERRRTHAVWSAAAPAIGLESRPIELAGQPLAAALTTTPPLPDPPPPVWPPPGAIVVYGRIDTVHCADGEKILVLQNRLFPMRFRLRRDRPPHLFFPPLGWKEVPCGVRGFEVNVAYRPGGRSGRIRGDAEALLF